ncbi:MAG: Carboxy-terminal domain (CTD) phosphatase [Pleopsidium flavum]|nr:MAG: Carboxy-terminal domain (CTD) phosphatase [Pleopsidium flavum]
MLLRLPHSLHYPITVTALLKQPNDNVERFAPLFLYFYKTTVTEGDELGNEYQVEKTFPTRFESNVEGVLREWKIGKGTVITKANLDVAEIEEPCAHEVQFGGMCANCGKDMTEFSYNTESLDAARATINMVHDNVSLTVSQEEATRVEEEAKRRLLATKKLSLVVDLDQTIIHATVDPTVEEWQNDKDNPNHDAVKDVRKFKLVDDGSGARGCWYYIKLRPGLKNFLENVSRIYELHIYTMGTRLYAQNIAYIVDPERKIFGDRILSRDESGSMTAKNLQRLFPVDTKMVVIIDDRGDVWKWSENLIKVTPYDFFIGIGDINSSFLPKKPELKTSPKAAIVAIPDPNKDLADGATIKEPEPVMNGDEPESSTQKTEGSSGNVSALEQLVSMGGGDDPTTLQAQASQQDETLAAQVQDRPLLQKQKQLEADDEAAAAASLDGENSNESAKADETPSDSGKPRHNLLQDNDTELQYLERSLRRVHIEFFDVYNQKLAGIQGGRIAQLRGEKHVKKVPVNDKGADLKLVPDIKTIMPQMKLRVLEGVTLVFSGVVPLGTDIQSSDIALWAKSFGAQIFENISKRTTHVIAARNRTAKVRQAARRRKIKIVTTQWLFDSISQWQRVDEDPYLIPVHPEDRGEPTSSLPGSSPSKDGVYYDAKIDDTTILSSSEEDGGVPTEDESDTSALHIRTDAIVVDDPEGVMPSVFEDEQSPVGGTNEDWDQMKDELADFLGSDADDSDGDSVASESSVRSSKTTSTSSPGTKRKFQEVEAGDADDKGAEVNGEGGEVTSTDGGRSSLEKRVKKAYERSTSLTNVATVASTSDKSSSLPTPENTGEDDEEKGKGKERGAEGEAGAGADDGDGGGDGRDDDDDWGDLEADLEAELQRVESEGDNDDQDLDGGG